jgi:hypothetical protein
MKGMASRPSLSDRTAKHEEGWKEKPKDGLDAIPFINNCSICTNYEFIL